MTARTDNNIKACVQAEHRLVGNYCSCFTHFSNNLDEACNATINEYDKYDDRSSFHKLFNCNKPEKNDILSVVNQWWHMKAFDGTLLGWDPNTAEFNGYQYVYFTPKELWSVGAVLLCYVQMKYGVEPMVLNACYPYMKYGDRLVMTEFGPAVRYANKHYKRTIKEHPNLNNGESVSELNCGRAISMTLRNCLISRYKNKPKEKPKVEKIKVECQ